MKRRMFSIFLAALWSVLLFGCGQGEPETVEAGQEAGSSVMDSWGFDVKLPEGFTLEPQEENFAIVQNGQTVGGLVKTSLTKGQALLPSGNAEKLQAYLESYVEPPLVMEYMAGSGKDQVLVDIDLIAYNLETQTPHEVSHYLFEKDSVLYDLFLDSELVDSETETQILQECGLYRREDEKGTQ